MAMPSHLSFSYCRQEIFVSSDVMADYIADYLVGDIVRIYDAQDVTVAYCLHRL